MIKSHQNLIESQVRKQWMEKKKNTCSYSVPADGKRNRLFLWQSCTKKWNRRERRRVLHLHFNSCPICTCEFLLRKCKKEKQKKSDGGRERERVRASQIVHVPEFNIRKVCEGERERENQVLKETVSVSFLSTFIQDNVG